MSKPKFWRDQIFYTDYPLTRTVTGEWIRGVVRRVRLIAFDGNKYATVLALDAPGGVHEIKCGYICHDPELTKYIGWRLLAKAEGKHHSQIKARFTKTKFHIWVTAGPEGYPKETLTFNTFKGLEHQAGLWLAKGYSIVGALDSSVTFTGTYTGTYDPRWERIPTATKLYEKHTRKPGPRIREFVYPIQ